MKLLELKEVLNGAQVHNSPEVDIKGITSDSRRVEKGSMFVAIRGTVENGHKYIPDAIRNGAAAILAEEDVEVPESVCRITVPDTRRAIGVLGCRFYGDPSAEMTIVGVTGTNGKTTTTHLVKSILDASGRETGLIGTVGYRIGRRNVPATMTTPDAVDTQALLAQMLAEKIRHAAIEVSSHALAQFRTDQVKIACGVFTNLTQDHLDYHRTMEKYLAVKARLFEGLREEASAVLNADDPACSTLASATKARVIKYGIKEPADLTADILDISIEGATLDLSTPDGVIRVESKLLGAHNVSNILAAAGAAYAIGVPLPYIKVGVEALPYVPGRLEPAPCGQNFIVLVDYAHTPDALESVLRTVRQLTDRRVIVVFGCGGNRDRTKRPIMGRAAETMADLCWVTSDNPRTEKPEAIIEDILAGMERRESHHIQPDRAAAIAEAIATAQEGDVVLIAGKGHERYQIFADRVVPFDDKEQARKAIEALVGS
ncbi:MAG: UDP-N-acetylmuramoyl-L-alanyl-D-glutamate--2,6-diaminopimelate ligase [Planctomycetes bacterium]|nr:UDP-N-acetylmuramoyl-L-alanyl-D-glutamate--2,6-diaminopimelate ligase [Planctomycetota bacterium]